jgi:hypothetical protein
LGKSGPMQPLSGPETSATAMGVDFLLQELARIETQPVVVAAEEPDLSGLTDDEIMELAIKNARLERIAAARRLIMEDMAGEPEKGDESLPGDILFGRKGLDINPDENEGLGEILSGLGGSM